MYESEEKSRKKAAHPAADFFSHRNEVLYSKKSTIFPASARKMMLDSFLCFSDRITGIKLVISSLFFNQLIVCSTFNNASLLKDHNTV